MYGLGDATQTATTTSAGSVVLTPDQLAALLHPSTQYGQTFSDFLGEHVTGQVSLTTLILLIGGAGVLLLMAGKLGGGAS